MKCSWTSSRGFYRQYLEAGADIIETEHVQREIHLVWRMMGLESLAHELSKRRARKRAARGGRG